jgi:hypothetical protein
MSGEIAVLHESDSQLWKKELNKEHYGVDKYWVFFRKNKPLTGQINFTQFLDMSVTRCDP